MEPIYKTSVARFPISLYSGRGKVGLLSQRETAKIVQRPAALLTKGVGGAGAQKGGKCKDVCSVSFQNPLHD